MKEHSKVFKIVITCQSYFALIKVIFYSNLTLYTKKRKIQRNVLILRFPILSNEIMNVVCKDIHKHI